MTGVFGVAKSFLKTAEKAEDSKRINDITPMKLLKLTYIAHGWMLALHDRPIFEEKVWAWKYGPVIPELYEKVREYRRLPVSYDFFSDCHEKLDIEQQDIVEQTLAIYGKFDAINLSARTHTKVTPWYKIWNENGKSVIPNSLIKEYYVGLSVG